MTEHSPEYVLMPHAVLDSQAWMSMTGPEVKLLMDLAVLYRGNNNGDLSCTWSGMSKRGWASRDTLAKALSGLLEKGLISRTRQGGKRVCSLYALSWEPINECGGVGVAAPATTAEGTP